MNKKEAIKEFETKYNGTWNDNSNDCGTILLVTMKNIVNLNGINFQKFSNEEREEITLFKGCSIVYNQTIDSLEETINYITNMYGSKGPLEITINALNDFISIIKQYYLN